MLARTESLAVYVHIPFCVRKCPYCDFNSGPADSAERTRYIKAVCAEIEASPLADSPAQSLFLGGGTPTEMTGDEIEILLDSITATFDFEGDAEWTIECNPGTVNPATCDRLYYLGFNRVSIGVQSFEDRELRVLGRIHTAKDALNAFEWFRGSGFENINVDLIYGLPDQSLSDWIKTLERVTTLAPEHLSLYNLTIEPGTVFSDLQKTGQLIQPDDDLLNEMFDLAVETTESMGYRQYEISNYCQPGFECVHNLAYWTNAPYVGFGVSAASYVKHVRRVNTGDWNRYLHGASIGTVPHENTEELIGTAAMLEEIMLRLRLRDGISNAYFTLKYGVDLDVEFADTIQFLEEHQLVRRRNGSIVLTRKGQHLASEVTAEFMKYAGPDLD